MVTKKPHAPEGMVTRCRETAFPGRPRALPASSPCGIPTASLGGELSGAFPDRQRTVPTENELHMFDVRLWPEPHSTNASENRDLSDGTKPVSSPTRSLTCHVVIQCPNTSPAG